MYDWSQVKIISLEAFLRRIFKNRCLCETPWKCKCLIFDGFLNYVTRYNVQKFFQSLHIMYDWSQVKIISLEAFLRRIFKNRCLCETPWKCKCLIFDGFLNYVTRYNLSEIFSKPPHHVWLVTSKNNITGSLSEKIFLKIRCLCETPWKCKCLIFDNF